MSSGYLSAFSAAIFDWAVMWILCINIARFASKNALYAFSFSERVLTPAYILTYARLHSAMFLIAADWYLKSSSATAASRSSTQYLYKSTIFFIEESFSSFEDVSKSDRYFMDSSLSLSESFSGREKSIDGISTMGKKSFQRRPFPIWSISQSTDVPSPVPYVFLWR